MRLSYIVALFALAAPGWAQGQSLHLQSNLGLQMQIQQQQQQLMFQQSQIQRQQQILDHDTAQQRNATAATRNQSGLVNEMPPFDPPPALPGLDQPVPSVQNR